MNRFRQFCTGRFSVFFFAATLFSLSVLADAPRNIILMIGDGMGHNHVLAADYYEHGETGKQAYQHSGFHALSMTTFPAGGSYDPEKAWNDPKYPPRGVTDSAAAATALSTGAKTKNGMIGLGPEGEPLETMADFAKKTGRVTGLVTTVPVTHATPAGFAAHKQSRNLYTEIANEIIEESPVVVLMGAGHPEYDNSGKPVENTDEKSFQYVGGAEMWERLKSGAHPEWQLIQERADAVRLQTEKADKNKVIGVFKAEATLQAGRESADGEPRDDAPYATPLREDVPSLSEISQAALNHLTNTGKGFFLMIEGGAIDWTSHNNALGRMIEEQTGFNGAVSSVVAWIEEHGGWEQNLLIITADHETGYLKGPDSAADVENKGAGNLPGVVWTAKGHTNYLVPFYVRGAGGEEFVNRATGNDPVRGKYIDNTDVAKGIREIWK
ncbi:MAG: alkaline phosphatase [Candidatus Hydrogenedentes bacterium]|nr:alkaline phosphatase [Candidatus Hydrogenedentota bacterium]